MIELAKRISALYLAGFLILGFVLSFTTPPFQAPDEDQHWISAVVRIEKLFHGSDDAICSQSLGLPEHFETHDIAWHPDKRVSPGKHASVTNVPKRCFENTVNYGGILSYPGVLLSRILLFGTASRPAHLLLNFYLSRIFHGLIVLGVLFRFWQLSFRRSANHGVSPVGALTISTISLSPLFAQQSFAVSSDVTTNAFAISMATMLVHWRKITKTDWVLFSLFGFSACSTKPTILPSLAAVVFAIVLFAWKESGSSVRRDRKVIALGTITTALIAVALWTSFGHQFTANQAANLAAQKEFLAQHSWAAVKAIFSSVFDRMKPGFLFHPLGWTDTYVPTQLKNIWIGLLAFAASLDLYLGFRGSLAGNRLRHSPIQASLLAFGALFFGILVSAFLYGYAMYLSWTPVGAPYVDGLQGRYFFPHYLILTAAIGACFFHDNSADVTGRIPRRLHWSIVILLAHVELFSITKTVWAVAQRYW